MDNQEWIESRKEYFINEKGEQVLNRVITERKSEKKVFEKKDWVDLTFKIIGLVAIITPLYLTYYQRQAEITKQRSLYELDLITNTTAELHSILTRKIPSDDFNTIYKKIYYEIKPKMALLNNGKIDSTFDKIQEIQNFHRDLSIINVLLFDSLSRVFFKIQGYNYDNESYRIFKKGSSDSLSLLVNRIYADNFRLVDKICSGSFNTVARDSLKIYLGEIKPLMLNFPDTILSYANQYLIDKRAPFYSRFTYKTIKDKMYEVLERVTTYLLIEIKDFERILIRSNSYLKAVNKT